MDGLSRWASTLRYTTPEDNSLLLAELRQTIEPKEIFYQTLKDTEGKMSIGKKLFTLLGIAKHNSYYGDTCYVEDVIKALDAAVVVKGTSSTYFTDTTDTLGTHTGYLIGVQSIKDKRPEDFLLELVKLNKDNSHYLAPEVQDLLDEVENYVKTKQIK
jgi:hypothetical protein